MGGSRVRGWLAVAVALAAAPALCAEQPMLVLPGFTGTNVLMLRQAAALERAVRLELERSGAAVVRGPETLDPARQEVLRQCGLDVGAPCPGLPGEDWLLAGRVRGGSRPREVELRLVRLADGVVAWRDGAPVDPALAPPAALTEAVLRAASASGFTPGGEPGGPVALVTQEAPPPEATPPSPRAPAWSMLAVGGAGLVAGGIFYLDSLGPWNNLHSQTWRSSHLFSDVRDETARFNTDATVGLVAVSAGGALLAGGLLWLLLGSTPDAPAVAVSPAPGGLLVGGRW